jgi:hypothetical protein
MENLVGLFSEQLANPSFGNEKHSLIYLKIKEKNYYSIFAVTVYWSMIANQIVSEE